MSSKVSSQVGQTCPASMPGQVGQVGQNTIVPPFAGIDAEGGGTSGTSGTPPTGGPRFVPPVCPGSLPLAFAELPSVGAEIAYRGQRYVFTASRPHIRRDGAEVVLLDWTTNCAACGAEFTFSTPIVSSGLNRRCKACAKPGRRVRRSRMHSAAAVAQ